MRKCPRNLDSPLLLFGLEPEDVAIVTAATGAVMIMFDPFYGGLVFFISWFTIRALTRGKPRGYLTHLLYKHGVQINGLIDPPRKRGRYNAW